MLILTTIIIIILIVCTKALKLQRYWKRRNVRYVKPWPFFGYMAPSVFRQKSFADTIQSLYNTFPEQRYFGCYQFLTPVLMIRDPELIEKVMVNHFDIFPQHKNFIDSDVDPIWAKNLFTMKGGDEWRKMRSIMSPMFTNSTLKNTFDFMKECGKTLTQYYQRSNTLVEVDIKDVASRFANDVIASAIFGIRCNSIENPKDEFYRMTQEVTNVSAFKSFRFFVHTICPRLAKCLNFRVIGRRHGDFYTNLIKKTISERMREDIFRPDMVSLLMNARKSGFVGDEGATVNCEDEDIVAEAMIFVFAGFDTVSTTIGHVVYELALNSTVQKKLREEILNIQEEITYEQLSKMKYLDMVVSETLRKWPSNAVIDRECVAEFIEGPERVWENTLHLEANTLCIFPIFAIHRDPKIYANPNKFDPERFSDENARKIKPFTYLPFGAGPRSCMGSQFAILEIKVFVFLLVAAFEIVRIERTKEDLPLSCSAVNLVFDDGFWVGLKPHTDI